MGRTGDPPSQIRQRLEISKRYNVPFSTAWRIAVSRCLLPHEKPYRDWYRDLLHDPEHIAAWEAAYLDLPHPSVSLGLIHTVITDVEHGDRLLMVA